MLTAVTVDPNLGYEVTEPGYGVGITSIGPGYVINGSDVQLVGIDFKKLLAPRNLLIGAALVAAYVVLKRRR